MYSSLIEKFRLLSARFRSEWARVKENPKPTPLQAAQFWSLFTQQDKWVFLAFMAIAIISGVFFTGEFFESYIVNAPDVGGSYVEGVLDEPRFVNPILVTNETEQSISNLVFLGLFQYSDLGVLTPALAESYTLSEDGKRYDIKLRKDVQWHDGKPVTADDVAFTVALIQNPDFRSPLRPNWQGVTVEKIDDHALALTLRQPYAPFLQNLTVGILPQHIWASIRPENSFQAEFNLKPIGSGPYQFEKLTRSTNGSILTYTLVKSETSPADGAPFIEEVAFQVFSSEESMLSAYQRGRIQGMSVVSAENASKISVAGSSVYTMQLPQVFGLFFNQSRNKVVADPNVREALELAIDRTELIKQVFNGSATAISTPIPPGSLGFDPKIAVPGINLEKAGQLLDKSGWKLNPDSGLREKTIPKTRTAPASTEILTLNITTSLWPDLVESAEFIKRSWEALGIEVTIQTAQIAELEYQNIRTRNYDILLFGEGFGHDPDPFAFWHSSQIKHPGLNLSLYVNKKVDTLLESARRAKTPEEAAQKYKEFQALVVKDRPAIFLYTPHYFFVMRNAVQGASPVNLAKPSERFYTADHWYIDTDWKFK